jgi:hypothetical protein
MWAKLKREWKTAAWGIASTVLELSLLVDPTLLDPFIDPKYHGLVHFAIPAGFLLLRRWKDAQPVPE